LIIYVIAEEATLTEQQVGQLEEQAVKYNQLVDLVNEQPVSKLLEEKSPRWQQSLKR